ncbi:ABC transporter permease [Nesterenkonia sp. CL21]|uniref:ABC transporter permease n=1 Tax=Nesterenkonia sp. CL21 TaxID=3064894 RepID=UPI00287B3287|nr:ABC transporter permease [Nesterenkonia sp. CL21]MDS2173483.1 ABC transporter permease [Nesterenkonia sp. CL21]
MTIRTAAPPSTTTPAARRPRGGTNRALWGTAGVLSLILVLELLPRSGAVDARFLPPFSEIAAALADRITTGEFWTALGDTLVTWAIGFSIALVAGIVLGMVIGSVGILRDATASTIEFLRPIPSVALIPLAVLMLGTGRPGTLLLVVYATFWQVLVQVLYGVQDVDPVARDTARSYRFRFLTTARTVVWPTTLPFAMTGFRLGATVALILTITGELIIGTPGLGRLLAVAQQSGQVSSMYALVIVTGLIGVLVNLGARAVERRVLHWHSSVRRETAS